MWHPSMECFKCAEMKEKNTQGVYRGFHARHLVYEAPVQKEAAF